MYSLLKYIIVFSTLIISLIGNNIYSFANQQDSFSKNNYPQDNTFIFFPQVGLGINGIDFINNDSYFKGEISRIIDIDALRFNNFAFSFYLNEFLLFNQSDGYYLKPYSINYIIDFGRIRWESTYGILSIFFDHNCSNIINENTINSKQLRWYGTGIRWESYGMQTGRKDIKINFKDTDNLKFINDLNYKLSIGRKIHTQAFDYDYMISGNLRYDILKYYFFVPYFEGSMTALIGNHTKYNKSLEAGIRMHFDKGDFIPFAGLNHNYYMDYYNNKKTDLYYFGFGMETLLGDMNPNKSDKNQATELSFPDFHFSGSYGKYLNNDNLNFNTDILIGIDFTNSSPVTPFLNSRLIHNSQKASAGMFPRYIQSNLEAGFSYRLEFLSLLIEPIFGYFRYDEGNYYHGNAEEFSTIGIKAKNDGMKIGFANNGIDYNKSSHFKFINTIDWLISAQKVVKEKNYKYYYEYIVNLRWNIFRYRAMIPYASAGITLLKDENYDKVYNIEHGVRIQNGLYWMLFYRYEYRSVVDPDNGLFRKYHLFGIRLEI
jgi:hypothetical protein